MGSCEREGSTLKYLKLCLFCALFAVFLVGCGNSSTSVSNGGESDDSAVSAENAALPLEGVVICVDPGHGITSEGGVEPIAPDATETRKKHSTGTAGKEQTEEELNLSVGLLVRDLLEKQGASVIMTRTTHECDLSNIDRANMAADNNADIVIRIHADGSENSSIHGISVLIPGDQYISDTALLDRSAALGKLILSSAVEATGAENRGLTERNDLTGFNWSVVPVALIEMGFMTNPEEDKLLADEDYQRKLASSIVSATLEYFSLYPRN